MSEFVESVRWAAREELDIHIEAPDTVAVELYRQTTTGRSIIHLVNYKGLTDEPLHDVRVQLRFPGAERLRHVTVHSPDFEGPVELPVENGAVSVPTLDIYSIVVAQP